MAYTYDPSQNIQQGFQQAASGVGNIFTQVIAQQQRDYNLAENAFQNIEALKKNLNIFGQKSITSKANELLGKTSSAIMKNGKLDYSALGDIRQQVSEIGDLKQGYDVGAKEYERMLQLGVANKDNLLSFEKFYKDLSAKMGDENLVKNPQDLQKALADTYTNNLDSFKMFGKSYLSSNPYQKTARDIVDPKTGALMRVQAELPAGWSFGAQGNIIPPAPKTMIVNGQQVTMDYADQELARLQATSPEQLVLMRKQAGFEGQNFSDKEIVKASIDKIPMTVQSTQVKAKEEIDAQRLQVKKLAFDVENQDELFASEMKSKRLRDRLTQAQINELNSKAGARVMSGGEGNVFNASFPAAKKGEKMVGDIKARATDLGGLIPMVVPTSQGNKNLNVKQVFYDENGNARVSYVEEIKAGTGNALYPNLTLPDGQSVNKASKSEKLSYALIPKAKVSAFVSSLESNLRAKYKDDKDYATVWNNVRSTFAPVKSNEYSSGQYDEAGNLYLDRSFEPNAAQILKDSKAKSIIYIN
jgi:hypothetical protein